MSNDDRALGRRTAWIWLLMGLVASCLLAAGTVALLIPPQFETHNQAVGYVLDQHGIAHGEIGIQRAWPDTLSRRTYSADVLVQLRDGGEIRGRIECKVESSQCSLYLRRLGLWHEPVPDLTVTPLWLARVQGSLSWLATLARGLVGA
jgi:hypothetical protein